MTLTAQAPTTTTPGFSSSTSPQVRDSVSATTENMPAAGLVHSTPPVETATESPQPAPLAIITANPLTMAILMAILAFVILSSVFSLLILLRKPEKRYLRNLIKSKSEKPTQETSLLETIQNQMNQQNSVLYRLEHNQQTLLRKTEDMEQSIKRIGRFQTVATAPTPRVINNPQPTPRLSPADHLVQILEQGGDRAALAQWSAVRVKLTASSQNRIHRG